MLVSFKVILKHNGIYPISCLVFSVYFVFLFANEVGASAVYYPHTNHQGSVAAVTNENGEVVARNSYYPYGNTLTEEGEQNLQEIGYTGQRKDKEVDIYYYNARYYDPNLSAFLSADPTNDQLNRFLYVSANPIMFIDPTGYSCEMFGDDDLRSACEFIESMTGWFRDSSTHQFIKDNTISRLFSVKDEEKISNLDLVRYRLIYEGMILVSNEKFLNRPNSGLFMNYFLNTNLHKIDLSNQLQEYVNSLDYEDFPDIEVIVDDDYFFGKALVNGIRFPFLGSEDDTYTSLGSFTLGIKATEFEKDMRGVGGMPGIYLINPQILIYDKYDWDRTVTNINIPIIGELRFDDGIGNALVKHGLGNTFEIYGEAAYEGVIFIPLVKDDRFSVW